MIESIAGVLAIVLTGSLAGAAVGWLYLSFIRKSEKMEASIHTELKRPRRYALTAIGDPDSSKQKAKNDAQDQIATALTRQRNQSRRPALMGYYDDLAGFRQGRVEEVEAFRRAGGKVVGLFCLFIPIELIRASGAMPIRLDCGLYCSVATSEQLLPSEACPVIKSSLGAAMLELSPYLKSCDVVVCPSSCEMKTKLGEILEDFTPIWRIDVPSCRDDPLARRLWLDEMKSLKRNLERLTGQDISAPRLKHSIQSVQDAQAVFRKLRELRKAIPVPISGSDALLIAQTMWFEDLERWTQETKDLCRELEQRVAQRAMDIDPETPRIMLAGSPIIWPNWKLPSLIEESGAVIVCDELCSGDQGGLGEPVNVGEWTMKDMLAAIADRYLLPVTCPCLTSNDKRIDNIVKKVKDSAVDGVVYHQLRGCFTYKIEFSRISAALKNLRIPVLGIETDYTYEDVGQMRTRIEAFLEMIQSAKEIR